MFIGLRYQNFSFQWLAITVCGQHSGQVTFPVIPPGAAEIHREHKMGRRRSAAPSNARQLPTTKRCPAFCE